MILTILFAFVLLIGISLFVAVVGTAFLRRHSTRVVGGMSSPRSVSMRSGTYGARSRGSVERGGDFSSQYRSGFEQRVGGKIEPEQAERLSYIPVPEREFVYRRPREAGGEGRWFLLTLVILVVVMFSFYFGIRGYQNILMKPRLFFCEGVDFTRLKPINSSDTFTRGNVTIFVKSRNTLETDRVRVDIYRIDNQGLNLYSSKELPVKQEWTSFSFKALFEDLGTYSVMVYGAGDQLLNQENIHIVPDSYAYTPVLKQ